MEPARCRGDPAAEYSRKLEYLKREEELIKEEELEAEALLQPSGQSLQVGHQRSLCHWSQVNPVIGVIHISVHQCTASVSNCSILGQSNVSILLECHSLLNSNVSRVTAATAWSLYSVPIASLVRHEPTTALLHMLIMQPGQSAPEMAAAAAAAAVVREAAANAVMDVLDAGESEEEKTTKLAMAKEDKMRKVIRSGLLSDQALSRFMPQTDQISIKRLCSRRGSGNSACSQSTYRPQVCLNTCCCWQANTESCCLIWPQLCEL